MSKQNPQQSPWDLASVAPVDSLARTLPAGRPPRRWPKASWPAAAPELGSVLADRYVLEREIGEGAFGVVYEARDMELEQRVAVKVASGPYATSREGVARFQREAIAASSIGHDSIVDVIDSGREQDGTQYIVMEYLEGTDLAGLIATEGPLAPERALRIAAQIADALAAAHRAGVVHRDLKPANIHIRTLDDGADAITIIDFGVSKLRSSDEDLALTIPGRILGSPCYMAPEQARGMANIDGRADVYALGVIVYEMLTGRPPFTGDRPLDVIEQHLTDAPLAPSRVDPSLELAKALDGLVMHALAKAPGDRFQDMDEFRDAIEAERDALAQLDRQRRCVLASVGFWLRGRHRRPRTELS
jgi:serine/threonine-protein kinase